MLTLPTTKAAPGMTLAMSVLHPQKTGHVLLKPGCVLDARAIMRLQELGVRRIGIEYPPTAFLMRYTSTALMNEQSRVAERVSREMDRMAEGLHADFDLQVYADGVRSLIQRLVDEPEAALFMRDIVEGSGGEGPSSLAAHAFNVGLLSLLMGLKLDGYLVLNRTRITRRRQLNIEALGLGAMLHDIGVTRLPRQVGERFERNRDETNEAWREHVQAGFSLVKGRLPATASAAVMHHHQRMDGTGFPTRVRGFGPPTPLQGDEIHVFARIVAMADVFDRLRNPPGADAATEQVPGMVRSAMEGARDIGELVGNGGGPVPTIRALKLTLEQVRAGKLDGVVFKSLLAVVPAFPPGSIVTLSDGRRCVVTGWDPMHPCLPTVSVLPKSLDEALDATNATVLDEDVPLGEEIDLADPTTPGRGGPLRIAAIDGQDVSGDYFEALHHTEFDLRVTYTLPLGEGWDAIVEQTIAAGGKVG